VNVGVLGLGKVGLVLACTLAYYGKHTVFGMDLESADKVQKRRNVFPEPIPPADILITADIRHLVSSVDILYVCVATPHNNPRLDGTHTSWVVPEDFDYEQLNTALRTIAAATNALKREITVVVLSTVAPGTFNKGLRGLANKYMRLVYSPSFISLGTIQKNLMEPSCILVGEDRKNGRPSVAVDIRALWAPVVGPSLKMYVTTIEEAEIIKMTSNFLQSYKIELMNAVAQMCDYTGANVDNVSGALANVLNHGWIPRAGLPDGGACRPRDAVVLDYVADEAFVGWNPFRELRQARTTNMRYHASYAAALAKEHKLPIIIVGMTYKPGVVYTDGSPGVFLHNMLTEMGYESRIVDVSAASFRNKAVYVWALDAALDGQRYAKGSVVYDPWGTTLTGSGDQQGVVYVRPGRREE